MLTSEQIVLLSGGLSVVLPLAIVVREIIVQRRSGRGACDDGDGPDGPIPVPPLPLAPRQLPDCLIPKPMTRGRMRALEDA